MGFWLFCTASSLLIPLVMLLFWPAFFDKAAPRASTPSTVTAPHDP